MKSRAFSILNAECQFSAYIPIIARYVSIDDCSLLFVRSIQLQHFFERKRTSCSQYKVLCYQEYALLRSEQLELRFISSFMPASKIVGTQARLYENT